MVKPKVACAVMTNAIAEFDAREGAEPPPAVLTGFPNGAPPTVLAVVSTSRTALPTLWPTLRGSSATARRSVRTSAPPRRSRHARMGAVVRERARTPLREKKNNNAHARRKKKVM